MTELSERLDRAATLHRDQLLDMLKGLYPDVLSISPGEALKVSGLCSGKDPAHSARQAIYRKKYPFPIVQHGNVKSVLLTAIADVMAKKSQLLRSQDPEPEDAEPEYERPLRGHPDMIEGVAAATRIPQEK